MKRKFEDFIEFDDVKPKIKQAKLPLTDPVNEGKTWSPSRKARKMSRPRQKPKKKGKEDNMSGLSISASELKKKVEEELKIWIEKWTEKDKAKMDTCDNDNCSLQLSATEMVLHKTVSHEELLRLQMPAL